MFWSDFVYIEENENKNKPKKKSRYLIHVIILEYLNERPMKIMEKKNKKECKLYLSIQLSE